MKIVIMAFVVAFASFATAQEQKKAPKVTAEQRIDFRVARVQKSLMLDDASADKFASIYKEYLSEMAKCRPELERGKDLSDKQIKKNIEARMDAKEKALKVERKYYEKLSKILNAKQLEKVFAQPEGFKQAGNKNFAPRGNRPGNGFAQGAPRNGQKMKVGKKPGKKVDCDKNCKECDNKCDKKVEKK